MSVCVRGDIGYAIALLDTHRLQESGPAITAIEELGVGEPQLTIDHGLPVGVKPARATREFDRGQRDFHRVVLLQASAFFGRCITKPAKVSIRCPSASFRSLEALGQDWAIASFV